MTVESAWAGFGSGWEVAVLYMASCAMVVCARGPDECGSPRSLARSVVRALFWPVELAVFLLRVAVSVPVSLYRNEWILVSLARPRTRLVEKPVDPEPDRVAEAMREVEEMLK